MMEKKFKAATERVAEGNLRNERQYLPPVMEFTSFTLEKGFACSVPTHPYNYQEEWYDENRDKAIGNENYKEGFDF